MSDRPLNRREFFRRSLDSLRESVAGALEQGLSQLGDATRELQPSAPRPPVPELKTYRRTVVRPPGALPEPAFLATCERCRKCVDACHLFCIIPSQPGMAADVGTPYLLPEQAPCDFCHECVEVCPTGALRPFDPAAVKIGLAVVEELHCLVSQGEACDLCYQACPIQDQAITQVEGQLPVIHHETCTGCGFCGEACPAPARAITVIPL